MLFDGVGRPWIPGQCNYHTQPRRHWEQSDPFLPVTNGSYGVPQLRFAQSLYDCGVGAQVSHLTPPTHALAEGSSDTCSPKDNRPDLNLQRVLTI